VPSKYEKYIVLFGSFFSALVRHDGVNMITMNMGEDPSGICMGQAPIF